jgi:hypothetical protein
MPNVDIIDGMAFGTGVDLGGQIFGDGVVRTQPEVVGGGQTTDIFLTLVDSQEDQDKALNLSTDVSAAFGLFGGSAKFDLSQKMHFHQFSITLIIRATVVNAFTQMRDVQLTESAKALIQNGDMKRFRERFGDFFVRGLRTGGEFCAILQIIGRDQDDQDNVRAALQAGGILGGVAASTNDSFSTVVKKATLHRETRLRHVQIGGEQTASINPEEMVAHALKFATGVREGQSEAFTALVVPYETLDLPQGANFIDIMAAKETLELLMRRRRDALTRLTAFDFVLSHPEQFVIPSGTNINAIIGRFENAVAKLTSAASRCVNAPLESQASLQSISDLDIPLDELPPRHAAPPSLAGVWQQAGSGHGSSKWTFTLRQGNQYDAVEEGLGAARGTAVVEGLKVTLAFQASVDETTGRYTFQVNSDFTSGDGTIEFFTVHTDLGILHNHWTKLL